MVERMTDQVPDVVKDFFEPRLTIHQFGWARVTPVGLEVTSRDLDYEQYEKDVNHLLAMDNASQWSIGDAYNWGLIILPKSVDPSQAFTARKVKVKTIQNYAWVCNRYTFLERMYPPSFSHHSVVAKLPQERRYYWLILAIKDDMSVEELSEVTADERGVSWHLPDPFSQLVDNYNSSIEAYQRLPDYPEKETIRRGLKVVEEGIKELEARLSGKDN